MKFNMRCLMVGIALLLSGVAITALAGNPLVPGAGMADPHAFVFNDKVYIYATRDVDPKGHGWNMPDWNVWSSDDLINWTHETVIKPEDTFVGEPYKYCWAPDAAEMNGKYYVYLSIKFDSTAVVVSDDPAGPFKDALGKPIIDKSLSPTQEYDVSVPVDNGVPYIVWGVNNPPGSRYHIARMNTDMLSLAEKPKTIDVLGGMQPTDKPNIHIRDGKYYLSAGSNYAIADNIYGPYETRLTSKDDMDPYGWNQRAHGNFFEWNNQWFFVWCRYTERGHPVPTFRESLMTYVHYKENGDMVYDRDFLDAHCETGVGQYNASWDAVEAEWFMAMSDGSEKTEAPNGGFEISNIRNGDFLCFPNIHDCKPESVVELTYSSAVPEGGTVTVRENDENGQILGQGKIKATDSWDTYQTVSIPVSFKGKTNSIALVFEGGQQEFARVDRFRIQ